MTMEWEKLKQNIYYLDGSFRDIYIKDTIKTDWKNWIDFVNKNYTIEWFNGKTNREETQIDFNVILEYWNGNGDFRSTAKIFIDKVQINAHFFTDDEIENDIDPRDIITISDHDIIIDYMKRISVILGKTVILTPENEDETVLVEVNGNNVKSDFE